MDAEVKEDKIDKNENGFYCEVCDCIVKDSLNYLDHVNGKRHNQNLGISLKKFTDCTFDEVKEMLEFKRRERDEKAAGYSMGETDEDYEERLRKLKREKKKRQKARRAGMLVDKDDDVDDLEGDDDSENEGGDKGAEDDEAETRDDLEDEMAKMMGFSSFSSSKK